MCCIPSYLLNHFKELCFAFPSSTLFIFLLEQSLITYSEEKKIENLSNLLPTSNLIDDYFFLFRTMILLLLLFRNLVLQMYIFVFFCYFSSEISTHFNIEKKVKSNFRFDFYFMCNEV